MDVEFNVSMHCNDCERKIARVISKFKGINQSNVSFKGIYMFFIVSNLNDL